jgi:methyl-accepting chemotaxis protein
MRLKLFLAFILIIVVTVSLVAVLVRWGTVNEVRAYMVRGGMLGLSELAGTLEEYYATFGSWQGVEQVMDLSRGGMGGMGAMMGQRLLLADPSGSILVDTRGIDTGKTLDNSQLAEAVPLTVNGQLVGYLMAVGGLGLYSGNEQQLFTRLNQAVIIAGLVAVGLGLLLALVLAYTLLRPVRELTNASQRLAEGDLSQRVQVRAR